MSQTNKVLLQNAIFDGVNARFRDDLSVRSIDASCTREHLQKLDGILGFNTRKALYRKKRKMIIAAIVAAAILLLGCITVYAHRDQVRDWFIRIFEDHVTLEYPGEQPPATINENYRVAFVPDEFTLVNKRVTNTSIQYEWVNASEQSLVFYQTLINAEVGFDGDDRVETTVVHGDLQIYCRRYESCMFYVWNDGKYLLEIHDSSFLPLEDILNMIDSIYFE